MRVDFALIYWDVRTWAEARGIRVGEQPMPRQRAGMFDGVSATMNSDYGAEERTYYLAHALGSIVRWSLTRPAVQELFDELRAAKKVKRDDPTRLERAIAAYRDFEVESSDFAVWLLAELGHAGAVPSYTNFMRADLEALTEFHRVGRAPVWRDFLARWNEGVAAGRVQVLPFRPKPPPAFRPIAIEKQEILQEQG